MITLTPRSGKRSIRLTTFSKSVDAALTGYDYVGKCTTGGSKEASLCEAHIAFHRDEAYRLLDGGIVALKVMLRKRFDVVVTGSYAPGESPTAFNLKNERAHGNVLAYIANHDEHREVENLWCMPSVRTKRRKARKKQANVNMKPIFQMPLVPEDDDEL